MLQADTNGKFTGAPRYVLDDELAKIVNISIEDPFRVTRFVFGP